MSRLPWTYVKSRSTALLEMLPGSLTLGIQSVLRHWLPVAMVPTYMRFIFPQGKIVSSHVSRKTCPSASPSGNADVHISLPPAPEVCMLENHRNETSQPWDRNSLRCTHLALTLFIDGVLTFCFLVCHSESGIAPTETRETGANGRASPSLSPCSVCDEK